MIFLIVPMVSATKITYSANDKNVEDMTAHIKDTIIFGLISIGEQGTMELKSHKSPTDILQVGLGEQVTMYYDTNFGQAQKEALGDVSFIDMRTGKEVKRDWKFVYWATEEVEEEINECTGEVKLTCELRTVTVTKEYWKDFDSRDIPKGQIRIGVMVNNLEEDYIDGIWEVSKEKITRHASWTASLNANLILYTKMDGYSTDEISGNNGTDSSVSYNNAYGIINQGGSYDGSTSLTTFSDVGTNPGDGDISVSAWIKIDASPTNDGYIVSRTTGSSPYVQFNLYHHHNGVGDEEFGFGMANSGATTYYASKSGLSTGIWYNVVGVVDGTKILVYVNGVIGTNATFIGTRNDLAIKTSIGARGSDGAVKFKGYVDEVGLWNRSLTYAEVTQLYNSGTGISYTSDFEAITLISPAGSSTSITKDITFKGNITRIPINTSLIIDNIYNETNSSGIEGLYSFDKTLADGVHTWNMEFCSSASCVNGSARTITIDTTPFIEFVSPTPANESNLTQIYIPINVSLTETYFENVTFDFYKNGVLNESVNFTDGTRFYNFTGCTCANWEVNVTTCTTTNKCNSTETREFYVDILPPEINISSPLDSYDYLTIGQDLDLNFTIIDIAGHLDSCLYNYNGTNYSAACSDSVLYSTILEQEEDNFNISVYANDTFGNIGNSFQEWEYDILELNKSFNNETTEGAYEKFYLYLKEGSGINVQSVILHYNGQTDSSSLFSSGDDLTAMSELLIDGVSADTNKTLYFTITLTDSTTFNTTSGVQLVRDISIDDCSSNPYPLLYLYLKDEGARTLLSGTIETNIEILNSFNYAQVLNISQEETSVSYVDLCSNVPLNETDFLINAEIRYESENNSAEFYHIQRAALTDYPANISLFDLKTEDTTTFKVLYRNQDLIGVEGAVLQLQRKYISDGIYEVVEAPLTSSDSSGILHIDTNTNKYQITVVKNGEVLGLFQNLVFICESELTGECTLNLYDKLVPPTIVPLVDLQDFSSALETSIDNQTITLTYVVPSGTATPIQVLAVQKDTILGDSVICNQTVISSAGSIECAYETTIQDSKITYQVFKSGELIAEKGYVVQEDLRDDWGGANYILLVILMLSLVFMALSSPEWVVINAVIVVLLGGGLWLIRGIGFVEGLGSLMWLIVGAIILISKLAKQEDY